ncbi:hypothetical protein HF325_005344 [Metschnikowia pulcherrima]|uniref:Uncharacterized protein n=1 Tax=Metschnikowia pulcherrima TaxID=27326 RepID=A0A8H7GNU4_9ASCO|nr:hypothetical protein HF325_005344 [Metschnikowia pulcherrima]
MEPEIAPTLDEQEAPETATTETNESIDGPAEDEAVGGHYRILYEHSLTKCRHLVEKIKKGPQKHGLFRRGEAAEAAEEAAGKPRATTPAIELHPAVRPMSWLQKFFESARQFKEEMTSEGGLGEIDPQFCIQYGPDHFRTEMARVRRQNKLEAEKKAAAAAAEAAEAAEKDEKNEKHLENTKTEKNPAESIAGPVCAGTSQGLEGSSSEDEAASFSDNEDSESVEETSGTEEESTEEDEEDEENESVAELSDGEIFGENVSEYRTAQNPADFGGLEVGIHTPYCDSDSEIEEEKISELSLNDYSDSANDDDEEYSYSAEGFADQEESIGLPLSAENTGNYTLFSELAPVMDDATPRTTFQIPEKRLAGFFKDLKLAAKCFKWSQNDGSEESSDSHSSPSFEAYAQQGFLDTTATNGNFSENRKRALSFLVGENDLEIPRSAPVSSFKMVLRPQPKQSLNSFEDYKMKARNSVFGNIYTEPEIPTLLISLQLKTLAHYDRFTREFEEHSEFLVILKVRQVVFGTKVFAGLATEIANFKHSEAFEEITYEDSEPKVAFTEHRAVIGHPSFQIRQCLLLTIKSSELAKSRILEYLSYVTDVKQELLHLLHLLAGVSNEYGLFLERSASTPSSNKALDHAKRSLTRLLKPIKETNELLKAILSAIAGLKLDFSQQVPGLVQLAQTAVASRKVCMKLNKKIGLTMDNDAETKAKFIEMVQALTFLKTHADLWDVSTFEETLGSLSSGITAVTDLKTGLEMNIEKIIGRIMDLQEPPIPTKYESDAELVEALEACEFGPGIGEPNRTADSLDFDLMLPLIVSSLALDSLPLSSGA